MANKEHLKILKQGVKVWNQWRSKHTDQNPDLSEAGLSEADLSEADFSDTNLSRADLSEADLSDTNLSRANLLLANLGDAKLNHATLIDADLRGATLIDADLNGANLGGADLRNASIGNTNFTNIDLREVKGLSSVTHIGPSSIGVDTLYKSGGNIPEEFLRGCGVPESLITYLASLTRKAFDYYSCFISYSSKDQAFAERLHADLQIKGVRCWYAPKDLKIGDRFRERIEETIRIYDKVMIVVSGNSIESRWVEREVNAALEREDTKKQTVLFPIRLDEAVMESQKPWAAEIRRERHIGDFRNWQDYLSYKAAFDRLLRDLKAEEENSGK